MTNKICDIGQMLTDKSL